MVKAKFVNEMDFMEMKFPGPSEEDVWENIKKDPQKSFELGMIKGLPKIIILAIEAGAEIEGNIPYSDFDEEELQRIKELLRKRGKYGELFKLGLASDDYQLIEKVKDKVLPEEFDNIPPEEVKNYVVYNTDRDMFQYRRGFKMYKILKFIKDHENVRRRDIQRLVYELSYGKGEFQPTKHRGWFSVYLQTYRDKYGYIFNDKYWYITEKGEQKLEELKNKFRKKYPKLIM